MPLDRLADAARRQHALAFDLDHAGAAIAVGAIAGLGRITQMRNLDAFALGDLPDRLAFMRVDLTAIEHEGHAFLAVLGLRHVIHIVTSP